MKRAAYENPEAIERLERFRVLLLEHRDIWGSNPDKQTFLDLWVRSKQTEPSVIVVDKHTTRSIDPSNTSVHN